MLPGGVLAAGGCCVDCEGAVGTFARSSPCAGCCACVVETGATTSVLGSVWFWFVGVVNGVVDGVLCALAPVVSVKTDSAMSVRFCMYFMVR